MTPGPVVHSDIGHDCQHSTDRNCVMAPNTSLKTLLAMKRAELQTDAVSQDSSDTSDTLIKILTTEDRR